MMCKVSRKIFLLSLITLLALSTMPTSVFTTSSQTSWEAPLPCEDALLNQTLTTYRHDDHVEVGLSANLYVLQKDWPQPGQCELAVAVIAAANSRHTMGYHTFGPSWSPIQIYNPKTLTLGDDEGAWVNVETESFGHHYFNYYGSWYNRVFVTSNGFVVLDERAYNDYSGKWTSPTPKSIPTTDEPNVLIAPFWRDLDPPQGGSIIYGEGDRGVFTVAWIDVPNKVNGNPQSFAVQFTPPGTHLGCIHFRYDSITNDVPTSIGVEDQCGKRGLSIPSVSSEQRISFEPDHPDNHYRIERIKVSASKFAESGNNDNQAIINIVGLNDTRPGGINVELDDVSEGKYKSIPALTAGKLVLSGLALATGFKFLGIAGFVLTTADLVYQLSSIPSSTVQEADPSTQTAYIDAKAEEEKGKLTYMGSQPWDASVYSLFIWRLLDASVIHRLIFTVEVQYREDIKWPPYTLTTDSLELKLVPGSVSWYGRTNPDAHYYNFYQISTPYGTGYHIDTIGSNDYGYHMLGWSKLTDDSPEDYKVRPDGTIYVDGYFRQSDTFSSNDQPGNRLTNIYVMYSENLNKIVKTAQVLDHTDGTDWKWKSLVITGLSPGKPVKIGIGRPDSGYTDWNLVVEWARINVNYAAEPVCAMKTLTDGYFYVPNIPTDLLKVEMLFDNPDLVGDQIGGTSPYSTIQEYPDEKVSGYDLSFVASKFGLEEGMSGWSYMADVIPDKKVDGRDLTTVSKNYGKTGTYITDLSGVTVTFNTGENRTPDVNGFVEMPQDATSFTVKRNGIPIGAMVIFLGTGAPPIAYSTTFEFTVPEYVGDDVGKEVWYYVLAKVYVPQELSGENFYFVANADDGVQNVKLNGISKAGSGSSVNINLGSLCSGYYHLLEFEFVDVSGGSSLNFHVATTSGEYVWLARFRVYVPDYSENKYRYTITTHTNFPMSDRYFIRGFADDYIDDIKLGGGWLYQDWQWESYWETIYAWGDGFNVPCGYLDPAGWRDIELVYGVISGGVLDFQVLSFTEQPEKIAKGTPEFWASVMALPDFCQEMKDQKLYAGSEWYSDPGLSERKIIVAQELYFAKYAYSGGPLLWDAKVRFDVGVAWLDPVIDSETSFGITINLTYLGGVEKPKGSVRLTLIDIKAKVPTQALNVLGWEFKDVQGGKSIVNSDFKIATSTIVASAAAYALTFALPVGAVVGIAATGAMVNCVFDYVKDAQEEPFKSYGSEDHYAYADIEVMGPVNSGQSVNEVGFVRVKPVAPTHCGFVEVYIRGRIEGMAVFTTIRFPVYVI